MRTHPVKPPSPTGHVNVLLTVPCHDPVMRVTDLGYSLPWRRWRIWGPGELLPGETTAHPGRIVAEWCDRAGHPTSYALLGGRISPVPAIHADNAGYFADALPGNNDRVRWGLEFADYTQAIQDQLAMIETPIEITVAASGEIGSSKVAFSWLARFLGSLLQAPDVIGDDAALRRLWELVKQNPDER
jgi:hypothetical protein